MENKEKRNRIQNWIFCGIFLFAIICAGYFVVKTAVGLFTVISSHLGGEESEDEDTRSTQTKESKISEEELLAYIKVEDLDIQENEYGTLELTAQASMPDFSAYFAENTDAAEADAADAYEFEEQLFAKTEEMLAEEAGSSAEAGGSSAEAVDFAERTGIYYITQEITVNLADKDGTKEKDDWTEEELTVLAKQEAFDGELEEIAMEIMGNFLSAATDWDAEASESGAAEVSADTGAAVDNLENSTVSGNDGEGAAQ